MDCFYAQILFVFGCYGNGFQWAVENKMGFRYKSPSNSDKTYPNSKIQTVLARLNVGKQ